MQPPVKRTTSPRLLVALLLVMLPFVTYAQNFTEKQIKGVFLYKITKFIRWDNPDGKIKLCFIGDKEDQSGETIGKTVESLANKESSKFEVLKSANMANIKNCNLLFIGLRSEPNLADILAVLDGKPIVTISDIPSFTRRGGMFEFSNKNGSLTVELNFSKAKANNININSALQEMIHIID
jgi:hypothetical protein